MKVEIVHVAARTPHGFRWVWRREDGLAQSRRAFDFFYDCVADARASGYEVRLGNPRDSAPTSSPREVASRADSSAADQDWPIDSSVWQSR
jgi:hypothetical protein